MNTAELIDKRISELENWRGLLLARLRNLKIREGDVIDEPALRDLIRAAVDYNTASR